MDMMDLLILLLLALSTHSLDLSRQFHFIDLQKNWFEAQTYCRENFDDSVTIKSEEDWEKVQRIVTNSGYNHTWIGLYDDVYNWKWSLDDTRLYYDGENTVIPSSLNFVANDGKSSELCAFLNGRNLRDDVCSYKRPFVCYYEPNNSYIQVGTRTDWHSAQQHCRETFTDLPSLRTLEERESVKSVIASYAYWWVGLYRDGWSWSDQSESSEMFWAPDEPTGSNEDCVATEVTGWKDFTCDNLFPFICSGLPKRFLKIVLKAAEHLDLNEPLIQKVILQKVVQYLRDEGINLGLNLTWIYQPNGKIFTELLERGDTTKPLQERSRICM